MTDLTDLNIIGRLKFLAKDTLLYGMANSFSKLISVITFPLMTRYFSVESFGKMDILFAMANLMVVFFVFGQDSAVARFYYEYDKEPKKQNEVVSWSLYIQILLLIILLPVLLLNADFLAYKFTGSYNDDNLVKLVIMIIPFGIMINFSGNILKWTFQRKKFLWITMGSSILYLTLATIAVVFFKPDIIDIFYLYAISRLIFSMIGFFYIKRFLTRVKDIFILKALLKYATPYGLISIIAGTIPSIDRYFIANSLNTYQLGIYAVGYKVSSLLTYPITAFQTAWGPFYLSIFKEKNIKDTFEDVLFIFSAIVFSIVLFLTLCSDFIIVALASSKYTGSIAVVFPLLLSLAVTSVKDVSTIGIDLAMKTHYRLYAMLIMLITIVISIQLLIGPLGILGVAYALLIGAIVHFVFEVYISRKLYQLTYSFRNTIILFFATIGGGIFGTINFFSSQFLNIGFRLVILGVFIFIIYITLPKYLIGALQSKIRINWRKK